MPDRRAHVILVPLPAVVPRDLPERPTSYVHGRRPVLLWTSSRSGDDHDRNAELLSMEFAVIVLALNTVTGLVLTLVLLRRLRRVHPGTWERLGRPTLILNNSIANGLSIWRFLLRREYGALGDPALTGLAQGARWSIYLQTAALLIVFIWMFGG